MRIALAAVVLLVLGLLARAWTRPAAPEGPSLEAQRAEAWSKEWWPLAPGAEWRYQVDEGAVPFKTRSYRVDTASQGKVRVFESTDGKRTDDFLVRRDAAGGVHLKEYHARKSEQLFLPPQLDEGVDWDLRPNAMRARATWFEDLEVPGLEGPRPALRIVYETFYEPGRFKESGWYPSGIRWFVRGVGMVKEDLLGIRGPEELAEVTAGETRRMHLVSYQPGDRSGPVPQEDP